MTEEEKISLHYLVDNQTNSFVVVKTIEEVNELGTALAQYMTKPLSKLETQHRDSLIKEIADVEILLEALKYKLKLHDEVTTRIPEKMADFVSYIYSIGKDYGKLRNELN